MSDTPSTAGIRLSCQPSKSGNTLVFPYRLDNEGPDEVYAMQAVAGFGAQAADMAAVIIAAENGDAVIGRFMPPLPADRRIAVPLTPLARRVPVGGFLEGRIEAPLPLAEASPYFPELRLRQYEITEIAGVVLMIAYWVADPSEVIARQLDPASDLLSVYPSSPATVARSATQRFPTRGLQLFRRTDQFPRQVP
jgi:hypothetical protein